ncbi:MAG: RNA-binding S4 domain-containing protein [Thermodesulfovibrionia bacterium]|jgi:ribosome-associated protein|nr:RNA-binding S4 domain-containing protein [Thermodesulfovibrionia bacterium]
MNRSFELADDYIELIKLLKVTGLCSTGGMAKIVVEDGLVEVDGNIELRKRRKIKRGHQVTYEGVVIDVI